ncbi:MAG: HAD family hydrolase [Anaerolineales bacterium]|nr:HAD family hydrolase [Anaerolineales bacterium]
MTIKAILFDFDGVIVDSVNVKTEAFRELFSNEKEHLQTILNFHLANGGMSRFVKFEIIYRDILKKPLTKEFSQELGERFSKLVMQKVIECEYMPGALEFLQKYSKQIPLFIASGTPQDELKTITAKRGLTNYFKEIHGTPRSKPEIIRDIVERHNIKTKEMPFIGDAINDYKAALETNSPFYGYVLQGNGGFSKDVTIIRSFQELESALFSK